MSFADPQELLDRARSGDDRAWSSLLEACTPYLRLMAQRQMMNSVDGAVRARFDIGDVVQETCLEAHRGRERFRGTRAAELFAWLRTMLRHNVATQNDRHVVAQRRSVRREAARPAGPVGEGEGEAAPALRSDVTSPSQRAMRSEHAVLLAQALARLPDDQAEAVRLRHLEGWTLARMAEWFGRSEVAVASLLKRGLHALRTHLPSRSGELR